MTCGMSSLNDCPSLYKSTTDAAPLYNECCLERSGIEDNISSCKHPKSDNTEHALPPLQASAWHQQPVCQRGLLVCSLLHLCTSMHVDCGNDLLSNLHPVMTSDACLHSRGCRSAVRFNHCLHRYAEPTFEEEEEVLDGDFSGSMYGLIDNGKEASHSAPLTHLDQALSRVRQELSMQLGKAGADASLSSEVEAALSQVSGLASRLASSAKDQAQPASA